MNVSTQIVIRGESFWGAARELLLADRDPLHLVYCWATTISRKNLSFRPTWRVT